MSGCDAATGLMSLDTALARLLESAAPVRETEKVHLRDALGRVLAQTMSATLDVPPRDNSAVDGYAVHTDAITTLPCTLTVSQRIPAGAVPQVLQAGTAARIFTGAFVPPNANAVVMQEDCDSGDGTVTLRACGTAGDNIRPRGQDIHTGQELLTQGRRLQPQDLGLLASTGINEIAVYRRLRVAIFSTGDELAEPGTPAGEGQIYNSNRYTLTGFLQALGMHVIDLGRVEDTLDATREALASAASQADVIVSSGGVSVGEEDHVRAAIESLGKLDLWRLAIKPGKPLAFGHIGRCAVLGLPGNPSAVFVTFCIAARPFLLKMQGASAIDVRPLHLPAAFVVKKPGKRREFLRVRLKPTLQGAVLEKHPNQSSGVLSSASWSDGFAVIHEGSTVVEGDLVEYLPFSELIG